jgi:hypothetical protein
MPMMLCASISAQQHTCVCLPFRQSLAQYQRKLFGSQRTFLNVLGFVNDNKEKNDRQLKL